MKINRLRDTLGYWWVTNKEDVSNKSELVKNIDYKDDMFFNKV